MLGTAEKAGRKLSLIDKPKERRIMKGRLCEVRYSGFMGGISKQDIHFLVAINKWLSNRGWKIPKRSNREFRKFRRKLIKDYKIVMGVDEFFRVLKNARTRYSPKNFKSVRSGCPKLGKYNVLPKGRIVCGE